MSIRFKVILPYLLLTLIVAVTGAFVVTRLVSNSLEERLSNQLLEAGRVVSDMMTRQEMDHLKSAQLIAYTQGLGEALDAGDRDQIEALSRPVTSGLIIGSLILYDSQGSESIHLIREFNGTVTDVSQQDSPLALSMVTDLLAENNPESLPRRGLAFDPAGDRYYYFTAIPVVSEDNVVGVAVVGTSLDVIMPLLKRTSLADVAFYDETGRAIATTLGEHGMDDLFVKTVSIPPEQYHSVLNSNGTVQGKNIALDDRSYTIAYAPLKIADDRLGVFSVVLPLDFVVEQGSVSRRNYAFLYGAAMVAVILIGYFVARLIINPLRKLVRTSLAIAGGDLTQRTEIKSRDEIGVLANTFDEMTGHLQQRTLELEKTNKILEQMDRTKVRFIQVAAHELRTPLTLVQGYAQIMRIKSKENSEYANYVAGILEGTSRMVDVIDNMLDVSRIDTNQLQIMSAKVQIHEVLEKVEKTFQPALQERNLTFSTEGLGALPPILGDKDLLYKLFYHVIINAIKYTPDGGDILVQGCSIEESPKESQIQIAVKDTGIGIDPQNQKLVFEKFYQTGEVLLHSSGKTKFRGGGPGLGLAIARGIVNAHRGSIWLESPGFNETTHPGTTVFVRLPVNGHTRESS